MRQVMRIVRYVLPFILQLWTGVLMLAAVGVLEAFRLVLIKPILDQVLTPGSGAQDIPLPISGHHTVYLQDFVPAHFHGNAWTVVAYALVASSILRGIFDYFGTYLVNHAGFGMITNLRNDLYNSLLKRSAAFFQKHTTGTLISTIISDIERVQTAMSSILAEFLQQFFTFLFTGVCSHYLGAAPGLGLAVVCPVHHLFRHADWAPGAAHYARRAGQTGGYPERAARDHLRQPHREGLQHGNLGDGALPRRGAAFVPGESALGCCRIRKFSSYGCVWRDLHCFAAAAGPQRDHAW